MQVRTGQIPATFISLVPPSHESGAVFLMNCCACSTFFATYTKRAFTFYKQGTIHSLWCQITNKRALVSRWWRFIHNNITCTIRNIHVSQFVSNFIHRCWVGPDICCCGGGRKLSSNLFLSAWFLLTPRCEGCHHAKVGSAGLTQPGRTTMECG